MLERLQKYLARAGVASRRRAELLIVEGAVTVNGTVVRRLGTKVDPATDEVRVNTEVVRAPRAPDPTPAARRTLPERPGAREPLPAIPEGAVYYAVHKPRGLLSTVTDDRGRPTVMELLPPRAPRVFPVGRLDEDSEGLLLLTNDGGLTLLLTHPRYGVPKTYDLRIRGEVSPDEIAHVERGVWLSEGRTGPARMRIRRRGRDISHVVVTLTEGRNRELRRIFARLRHPVLSLRRTSVGPVKLENMRPGQCRRLGQREVRALYAAALRPKTPEDAAPTPGATPPRRERPGPRVRNDGKPRRDDRGRGRDDRPPRRDGGKVGGKPRGRPGGRPDGRPGGKPDGRARGKPEGRSGGKPGWKGGDRGGPGGDRRNDGRRGPGGTSKRGRSFGK